MDTTRKNMQHLLDNLTKPLGSLGILESLALKVSGIQDRVPPIIRKKAVFVLAGDHGITREGVSLYPQEVTTQMALNIVNNGAAINVIAKQCGFEVHLVDAGIKHPVTEGDIIDMSVAGGTRNFLTEPAMTEGELEACLAHGEALAKMAEKNGYDLIALGDMGIGNTTSAAAMLAGMGIPIAEVVDRGTGINNQTLEHKAAVIEQAVKNRGPFTDAMHCMCCLGGFELCTMTGIILALRNRGIGCVLDGFPVSSAGYMAWRIDPDVRDFLFAGHLSKVRGHRIILDALGLDPIIDLEMRLGEGTGAVLGGSIISTAVAIANEMASFDSARVSRSNDVEENY